MRTEYCGIIINQVHIDLDQLAHACHVPPEWVNEHLQAGLLTEEIPADSNTTRFDSSTLLRARRLCAIERDFDANPELAALVVDLMEQIAALKNQLQRELC